MKTKKIYVIGEYASKSLSPLIFNYWLSKHAINAEYSFKEIKKEHFSKTIKEIIKDNNIYGLNITNPFKKNIIKHLTQIDNDAKKIDAVNCVTIKNNKFYGSNTDWIGYSQSLKEKTTSKDRINKEVIIIGYGGAAKAILYALHKLEFKKIHIFNRSSEKMKNLYDDNKIEKHKLSDIKHFINSSSLIINTTPVNVMKNLNINKELKTKTIISDIVYNPMETEFLNYFTNPQKKIYGIKMLIQQAIPCFEKWFNVKPILDDELMTLIKKRIT